MSDPANPYIHAVFTFEDLHAILCLQADVDDMDAPTRGQVLDLVEVWRREAKKAERERIEREAMRIIARKKMAMKQFFLGAINGK